MELRSCFAPRPFAPAGHLVRSQKKQCRVSAGWRFVQASHSGVFEHVRKVSGTSTAALALSACLVFSGGSLQTHEVLASACSSKHKQTTGAQARLEGVNRPDLLPKENTPLIDVAGFLTPGEENRLKLELRNLEKDTGIKLRVLAQNYPETPGLAVKKFWAVDDDTVVMVADPGLGGNILNFNVGANVDLQIPRNFWSRLSGKYGNKFWWQEKGQEAAIVNAVSAIDTCFREPVGKLQCTKIQEPLNPDDDIKPKGIFGF